MLSTKQLMFVSFVWLIGTLCCLILEGIYFGTRELDIVNALTGFNILQVSGAGSWFIPKLAWGFMIHGLPKLIFWDYSYFQGGYFIIRLFFIMTLSVGVVYGITMVFVPVVQGIISQFTGR